MNSQDPTSNPLRLRQRILRAGWWTGGGFLLDKVIAAVQLAVLVRILTPADFGLMAASAWQCVLAADAASGGAAVQLDGRMVDLPVVLQARRTLARAARAEASAS